MKILKSIFFTILLLLVGVASSFGQLKFHVASFGEDQFDLAARDERFKKIDGSGALYAIIKVSGDDLKEYMFDFGNMNHEVTEHDGLLWIYVQKNAKRVTIRRSGYAPLLNYDLQTTVEEGKTYRMQLSAQGPVIYTQMVMFQVKPVDARATVMMRREGADTQEEVFGITDAEGRVANPLEYGTYTYRVMATNYHSTEGRITLNNQDETHVESVNLRSNGAVITLSVAQDAEIYVNGARKGVRSWKGLLKAGNYHVECRQVNHRPSSQNIAVTEGKDEVVTLVPPTPITGRLSVNSSPLNATIKVGGRVLGNTPKIIPDMLIGRHEIVLSREGYDDASVTVDVKEGETSNVNLTLRKKVEEVKRSINDVTLEVPKQQKEILTSSITGIKDWQNIDERIAYTCPNNVQEARGHVTTYQMALQNQDWNKAYISWKWLMMNAPYSITGIYEGMAPYMLYNLINASTDNAKKKQYFDDLMAMFEARQERLGDLNKMKKNDALRSTLSDVLSVKAEYYNWTAPNVPGSGYTLNRAWENFAMAINRINEYGAGKEVTAGCIQTFFMVSNAIYKYYVGQKTPNVWRDQYQKDYVNSKKACNMLLKNAEDFKKLGNEETAQKVKNSATGTLSFIESTYASSTR